jgi:hypothetical protein
MLITPLPVTKVKEEKMGSLVVFQVQIYHIPSKEMRL